MKVTRLVLDIILRPDCPARFVQDGSGNSFFITLTLHNPDSHAVGQGQDVFFAVITTLLFINIWCLCWGVSLWNNPKQTLKCLTSRCTFIFLNELEWFKISVSSNCKSQALSQDIIFQCFCRKACPRPWHFPLRNEWEEFPYRSCGFWLEAETQQGSRFPITLFQDFHSFNGKLGCELIDFCWAVKRGLITF